MISQKKTTQLGAVITDNLRVQRDGKPIEYIDSGNAVVDACSRQNHVVFARRGCGKTLLLHSSTKNYSKGLRAVYLNCEDFKRHTFPNVLIEILNAIFREFDRNISGWFGKGKKAKNIVKNIQLKLGTLLKSSDTINEEIRQKTASQGSSSLDASAGVDIDKFKLKIGSKIDSSEKEEIERSFKVHREKLQELDEWLPRLKQDIRDIFSLSKNTTSIIIQIDDLYHLKRTDQAFVVDYIHRLCKDVPL
jgi:Cdc6-like AAA superfamily ATPase